MGEVRAFVEMADGFQRLSGELRALPAGGRGAAEQRLAGLAARAVSGVDGAELEKLSVWFVDHFYRLLHRVSMLDGASFAIAHALGASLVHQLLHCGRSIAYLVDNQVAEDRLIPARPLFSAMGLVVVSPELLALDLAVHDGVAAGGVYGDHLERYQDEAIAVATGLFDRSVSRSLPVIWLSGLCPMVVYRELARRLEGTSYVGVFRNQAPDDDSLVQVFRDSSGAVEIDPGR